MLSAIDLRAPTGDIERSMFPQDTSDELNGRLDGYLTEAYRLSQVTALTTEQLRDEAAKAWAYHRSYNAIYLRLSAAPNSVNLDDEGSMSRDPRLIQNFATLARQWLDQFREVLPVTRDLRTAVQGTTAVPNRYSW